MWSNVVLTAAHCLDFADWLEAASTTYSVKKWKEKGVKPVKVKKFCKPHGYFKKKTKNQAYNEKDYAILVLEQPLKLDNYTQTACLPDAPLLGTESGISVGLGMEGFDYFADELQAISEKKIDCPHRINATGAFCLISNDDNYKGGTCRGKL